jgi:hypothetical protein
MLETYGVIGILERIREPSIAPGVAPPAAALRGDELDLPPDLDVDEVSARSRRNCSLFIAAGWGPGKAGADVNFELEKGPSWRTIR